jgi:hypothetical protein
MSRRRRPHRRPEPPDSAGGSSAAPPARQDDADGLLDWILQYAVPLAGVAGAVLYGVLRLAYVFFYLRVRATPEEVGYGYAQILAAELIGAVELVVFATVLLFVPALLTGRLIDLVRHRRGRPAATGAGRVQRLAARCTLVAVAVVLVGLPIVGWLEGAEAAKGYTVRNVYLAHTIQLPVLAVQAVPAQVEWTGDQAGNGVRLGSRRCLLYLGQADSIAVFFDVYSRESLRLPAGAIVVSLQNTAAVPAGC